MHTWFRTDEAFVFDTDGRHLETRSLVADSTLLSFDYEDSGGGTNLTSVTNKRKHVIKISRSPESGQVRISLNGGSNDHLLKPSLSHPDSLGSVTFPSGKKIKLRYDEEGDLVQLVDDGNFVRQLWKKSGLVHGLVTGGFFSFPISYDGWKLI